MISIEIAGKVGVGKTTLALSLVEWLKSQGFTNVTLKDIDVECGTTYPELQEKRLDVIKDRHVLIETIQLSRQ